MIFSRGCLLVIALVICFWAIPSDAVGQQRDLEHMQSLNATMAPPMEIDEERVIANGIQKLSGKFVDLYTDIRDPKIGELVIVFDAAVPMWCEFFGVDPEKTTGWRVSGFIIQDKERFIKAKLMPDDLPEFPAGYNRGHHMWVYTQPGDYYTRHLLLHEGTHSFMQWFLGGSGPAWYSEGIAEMLALHRWSDQQLQLNFNVKRKQEAEHWGRVKILREDFTAGNTLSIEDVFRMENIAFRSVRNYAWAWAACKFFSEHPLTRIQFQQLAENSSDTSINFSVRFFRAIRKDRVQIQNDWKLFITEMDYGIQIAQLTVTEVGGAGGDVLSVDSTRGWQKTGIEVTRGQAFTITASGQFQVANEDGRPWSCEPGGVTLEYYRGQPLGMLMAGVVGADNNIDGLVNQTPIGLNRTFTADRDGVLCLRINESPANLDDNSGSIQVRVK